MRRAAALALALVPCLAPGCDEREAGIHESVAPAIAKTRREHPERFRRKVVLLGFDSCDPDLVEEFVKAGRLPNFARLAREGATGALHSLQPTLSPVVWTTIATGMSPQRHGILDFVTKTPAGMVPVSSKMRQADTVWELLSSQGEKVGVVGWLVTWPADPVNGFLVTDHMGQLAYQYGMERSEDAPKRTFPEDLADRVKDDLVKGDAVTLAKIRPFLDISQRELDSSYATTFDPRNRVNNLRLTLATAESFRAVGQRLLSEEEPRFFACYFEAMDAISHLFMPYAPPKSPSVPTDLYLKYRTAIEANYIWHDRVLGEFMAQCDADTTLMVISDHGFKSGDFRMADASDFHAKTGAMWHRPYGVFYAWGNGVKRGARVAGASVYDIAPTVLAAMGYPVPDDMERGDVLEAAFEGGLPHERVPTWRGEARREEMAERQVAEGARGAASPEEEDLLRRLEALGYIGGDRSDPATTTRNNATVFLSEGRYEMAYQEFQRLMGAGDDSPPTLDGCAEAALRTGRLDEAEELVAKSLAKEPAGMPALMLRARLFLHRGKLPEADAAARQALERKNDTPWPWNTLALILSARIDAADDAGQKADAIRLRDELIAVYERSLALESRQTQILVELARVRLEQKHRMTEEWIETSRKEIDRALESNPGHVTALNNRAIAHLRLAITASLRGAAEAKEKHLAAALEDAEAAIESAAKRYGPTYKGYDRGWANKAYVLWHMGRLAEAAAAAAEARKIKPGYVFDPLFLGAMSATGHEIPPPAK